jgi:hypothetical protein
MAELELTNKREEMLASHEITRRQRRWIPPPNDITKVNADGAVAKKPCRDAMAAVCWDAHGLFLGASATAYKGITCLEALACSEALSLVEDLHVTSIFVASDF